MTGWDENGADGSEWPVGTRRIGWGGRGEGWRGRKVSMRARLTGPQRLRGHKMLRWGEEVRAGSLWMAAGVGGPGCRTGWQRARWRITRRKMTDLWRRTESSRVDEDKCGSSGKQESRSGWGGSRRR
jgi:hypothetical protein